MCTIFDKRKPRPIPNCYGYKVVRLSNITPNVGVSPFMVYIWNKGINDSEPNVTKLTYKKRLNRRRCNIYYKQHMFHCFKRLRDCRLFYEYNKFRSQVIFTKYGIIRVKLLGPIFKGVASMEGPVDGTEQICGYKAEWDGKFIR